VNELQTESLHWTSNFAMYAGTGRISQTPRYKTHLPWSYEAIGCAVWTGTPLRGILEEADLNPNVLEIVFTGADPGVHKDKKGFKAEEGFQRSLSLNDAMCDDVILAYEMNGQPLLPQHGFPLRLIVPGWYGMASVKWLVKIEAVNKPFLGYEMLAYRYKKSGSEVGIPVTRMKVRSVMIPPGVPEFFTRKRFVEPGKTCKIIGRAWSGLADIVKVEFSADGGASWGVTELIERTGPHGWYKWTFDWTPSRGKYLLACRATDSTGETQVELPDWNFGGFATNGWHKVEVFACDACEVVAMLQDSTPAGTWDLLVKPKAGRELASDSMPKVTVPFSSKL